MRQLKNELSKLVDSERADLLTVASRPLSPNKGRENLDSNLREISSKVLEGRTRTEYKHKQS